MKECPFIDKNIVKDARNVPRDVETYGQMYRFWVHRDPDGNNPTNVQFCKLIGRKRNAFECFNESEWKRCRAYRSQSTKTTGDRLNEAIANSVVSA